MTQRIHGTSKKQLRDEIMKKCAGCKKVTCDGCSLKPGMKIYSSKGEPSLFPEGFQPDKGEGFGIAFDIGTTTVAAMLWDLEKRIQLETETCVNPQRFAGSDVISRIAYSRNGKENGQRLKQVIVEKMDELAEKLCIQAGIAAENSNEAEEGYGKALKIPPVSKVTAAGNTVMCEILLGLSLKGLSAAPFHKEYAGFVRKKGSELGFSFLGEAQITVLPSIDGYVGADALAVYTYVKNKDDRKNLLAVDIGTNGEILLIGREKSYACSAAAGPALEGAAVFQGMGAAPGAIEEVRILGNFPRQNLYCKVIGDSNPRGICGSGLVDALAVLRKLKVIDETGYLLNAKEARKAGVPELVCRRLASEGEENRILLTTAENPVYLTSGDIRQLQLAKGAIRAGIEVLLRKAGITEEELTHIYLAGAFGSYIKLENAAAIGLLPDIPIERITHTGNCAGTGAVMALLSENTVMEMERYAGGICHVELAQEEKFQEYFLRYMAMDC